MGLTESINEIADQLEGDADAIFVDKGTLSPYQIKSMLIGYARQLRTAVLAAGTLREIIPPGFPDPEERRRSAAARRAEEQLSQDEYRQSGARMVECTGGKSDETDPLMVEIDPRMPTGAFTMVPGRGIYQLSPDGKLYFNEERTERAKNLKEG